MKVMIKQYSLILIFFWMAVIFAMPNAVFCNDSVSQKKIASELTQEFNNDGWTTLSFEAPETDTLSIRHAGVEQNTKLTDGQLTSALGAILKPDIVSKLKKAGFKKGVFIDGKSRKYLFNISTKYHNKMQAFFNDISGGR